MCKLLEVSSSQYYDWIKRPKSNRLLENEKFIKLIKEFFSASRNTYGTRRIRKKLLNAGYQVSRRRISRLMNSENLRCKTKRRFKATTDSKHSHPVASNILKRQFEVSQPNTHYVGDITYIWTQEGWLYLAVVMDLFSRRIVGWSMNKRMKASLVNNALNMAIWKRKPAKGLIWHTDRGSQYASESHRLLLAQHGIKQSMSRKGNCWDNSVAESFFRTLKTELTYHYLFQTRDEAKAYIFEYIEVFLQ